MVTEIVSREEAGGVLSWPDARGRFGRFGGQYAPETLMPALDELVEAWGEARLDLTFRAELDRLATHYVGRPTAIYEAERLSDHAGGARIFLKRCLLYTSPSPRDS